MSELPIFALVLFIYVMAARLALSLDDRRYRSGLFALVNIAGFVVLSLFIHYSVWKDETILDLGAPAVLRHVSLTIFYVVLVALGYFLLRVFAGRPGMLPWLAFFYPIALLIVFKYFYFAWDPLMDRLDWPEWVIASTIIGLSYMAFRLSHLVLEVRNGVVEVPNLGEYLAFAFFLPTLVVGPINPYSTHQRSLNSAGGGSVRTEARAALRIVVGAAKFLFLANIANQLTYSGLFLDGKPHSLIDLFVAVIFFYLFLYLNFSGFCDIAIGLAGLLGIRVRENFNNPFVATNVKDFWNRWHITLSEYTRDVIFTPVTKGLIQKFGAKHANFCISVGILCVFLVIGVWHGVGIFFVIFGLIHAAGVISNHYYTLWLKRKLGKDRYKAYNENRLVNAVAIFLTFAYVASSFVFFANTRDTLGQIKYAIVSGF